MTRPGCMRILEHVLPPLHTYRALGCGCHVVICTLFTILFEIPGIIYTMCVAEKDRNLAWSVIWGILLPPLGVYLRFGCENFGFHFWMCFVLTLMLDVPGIIYAIVVLSVFDPEWLKVDPRFEKMYLEEEGMA